MKTTQSSQRGVILVLFVILLSVLMVLCALVIGMGIIASDRSRVQNIANAAALAALEKWVALSRDPNQTFAQKADKARIRANEMLQSNKVPGLSDPSAGIGDLSLEGDTDPESAGTITYGMFYVRDPGAAPCTSGYPCMVKYGANTEGPVNSVQVRLTTKPSNPIVAPFADFVGHNLFQLSANATATLVQRCTSFILDASISTAAESHSFVDLLSSWYPFPTSPPTSPAYLIGNPSVPGLFAMDDASLSGEDSSWFCSDEFGSFDPVDRMVWCNTRSDRNDPAPDFPWNGSALPTPLPSAWPPTLTSMPVLPPKPNSCPGDPNCSDYQLFHFQSDYETATTPYGEMRIDKYIDRAYLGPQPLKTFLLAFNSGLRTLQNQQTTFDVAQVKAFTGNKVSQIPPVLQGGDPNKPFTSDLGYLVQITNFNNIGTLSYDNSGNICRFGDSTDPDCALTTEEIHPNLLDHGLFPRKSFDQVQGGTGLVEILDDTIQQMQQYCPTLSKKQIIIATDGVSSCSYVTHDTSGNLLPLLSGTRNCNAQYNPTYLLSEKQLIGEANYDPNFPRPSNGLDYPSILERAIGSEIAITVLFSGPNVEPNFINITDLTGPPKFISYQEAMGLEFGSMGYPLSDNKPCPEGYSSCDFFEHRSSCPASGGVPDSTCDQGAYENQADHDFIFRRPNGILGRLAMRSGGLWCPLMPLHPDSTCYIDGELDSSRNDCRAEGRQTYAIFQASKSQTASQCASEAVGFNPFLLSEPLYECYAPNQC